MASQLLAILGIVALIMMLFVMRDYRTGLYCVTKCCKARNYRLF